MGIIGLGGMGRVHLATHVAGRRGRLVAVADVDAKRLAGGWRKVQSNIRAPGGPRADLSGVARYPSAEELIADPRVEVVDVCLPTYLHAEYSIMALAAGKHVLCEKPIAESLAPARRLAAAAAKARGRFMVAHCLRFWPEYLWLKEQVIKRRKYGRVLAASFRRMSSAPRWSWRNWMADPAKSGGVPLDLHIHDVDFLRFAFGGPQAVSALGAVGKNGVNHIAASYRYDRLGPVTAEASWCMAPAFGFEMGFTVVCERATVIYGSRNSPALVVHGDSRRSRSPRLAKGDGYAREIDYFLECVQKNRAPRVSSAAEALKSLKLALAEVRSLRAGGRWVKV